MFLVCHCRCCSWFLIWWALSVFSDEQLQLKVSFRPHHFSSMVVQVEDFTGAAHGKSTVSYISIFSNMPGKLTKELANLGNEFTCGNDEAIDFVTFRAKYNCHRPIKSNIGWNKLEAPVLRVTSNSMLGGNPVNVPIDATNCIRWAIKVNKQVVQEFSLQAGSQMIIQKGNHSEVDGWHIIQFGGKGSPT